MAATATFAASVVLVRVWSQEEYGSYQQVMLLCATAGAVLSCGLPKSIFYYLPRLGGPGQRALVWRTILATALLGVAGAALGLLLRGFVSHRMNNPDLVALMLPTCVLTLLYMLDMNIEPLLLCTGRAWVLAALAAFAGIAIMVAATAPALLGWGAMGVTLGMATVYLVKVLFLGVYSAKLPGGPVPERSFSLRDQIAYSLPLGLASMTAFIGQQIDKFMISAWFDPGQYAVYSRGAFELPLVMILPYALADVLVPRIVTLHEQGDRAGLLNLWCESARGTALIMLPVFGFFMAVAEPFITLIFTDQYAGSVPVFRIYLLLLPTRVVVYGALLRAIGNTRSIYYSSLVTLSASLALNFAFYRLIGFNGPPLANVTANVLTVGCLMLYIRRSLGCRIGQIMPWAAMARIGAVSLVCGGLAWLLASAFNSKLAALLVSGLVFAVTYPLGSYFIGAFTAEDKALVREWLSYVRIPTRIALWMRRLSPRLYMLLAYGRTNPNTPEYWDRKHDGQKEDEDLRRRYLPLWREVARIVPSGVRVLDAGCGTGGLMDVLRDEHGCICTGLDISRVAVDNVRRRGFDAYVSNLPHIPLHLRDFDVCTTVETLEHLTDPDGALRALAGTLRAGGLLVASVPDEAHLPERCDEHVQNFTQDQFRQLVARHFVVETVQVYHAPDGHSFTIVSARRPGHRGPSGA